MGHQFEHMYNMYFMIANQFVKKNLCVSGLLFFQFERNCGASTNPNPNPQPPGSFDADPLYLHPYILIFNREKKVM